jgi:hypothetical protein
MSETFGAFDKAKRDMRELMALVVEIDRLSIQLAGGMTFFSERSRAEFDRKQARAIQIGDEYGL